jgi:hypothetical protein
MLYMLRRCAGWVTHLAIAADRLLHVRHSTGKATHVLNILHVAPKRCRLRSARATAAPSGVKI